MPHFLATKSYKDFPFSQGEYEFCYEIKSLVFENLSLILTRFTNIESRENLDSNHAKEFFIQVIKRENDLLYKGLGITRPLPTKILKDSLLCLANKCNATTHNLQKGSLKQEVFLPFLLNWDELFCLLEKDCDFVLEIGFGSGRHLLDMAKSNPKKNFIGFEIHTPSIEQVLRQIELLDLKNLYILCLDVRLLLEVLPSNKFESIYLHFPVPWNKAKHRRVMSKDFLAQTLRILESGGRFELRSDDYEYFLDSFHLALESSHAKLQINKNIKQEITSKYEARWLKQQKDIFDLEIFSLEESQDVVCDFNLIFPQNLLKSLLKKQINKQILEILTKKQVFQECFLHISDVYQDEERIVFIVSLGDFSSPLNRVILLENDGIRYFPAPLIPTKAVKFAYQKFIELLEKI